MENVFTLEVKQPRAVEPRYIERLIDTSVVRKSGLDMAKYINDQYATPVGDSIMSIVAAIGLTTASNFVGKALAAAFGIIGITVTVLESITNALKNKEIGEALDKMTSNNDILVVTTNTYEWESGKGDVTYYTDVVYSVEHR